jgi:penicillin amidase
MLAVSRARSFDEFRQAFATFSLPAQNMIYADAKGNIGQLMAVQLPARDKAAPTDLTTSPRDSDAGWSSIVGGLELPFSYNPEKGFLASANNRPTGATDIRVGYFFSPSDRVTRMAEIVETSGGMSLDGVRAMQQDVAMPSSLALRDAFLKALAAAGLGPETPGLPAEERTVLELLSSWDGRYDQASKGAVAFEIFRAQVTAAFYEQRLGADDWQAFADVGEIKTLLAEDLAAADPQSLRPMLGESLAAAAGKVGDFTGWGEMHRLMLRHPLAFLPVIGGRFAFADLPSAGSSETLMKTAHGLTSERHRARYGSNSRHISDMTDPDRNLFVLLGGQDGWLNSATFLDQVPLWREGRYIELPLRPETVRAHFKRSMPLSR